MTINCTHCGKPCASVKTGTPKVYHWACAFAMVKVAREHYQGIMNPPK